MSHIFISYSKKDRDYARKLADRLLAEGFSVWIDDRIDYGEDWWRTIVTAIKDCAAFVVIMSQNSDDSRWVQREVTIADELRKPTFPLLLAGNLLDSKHWSIYVRTQYKDVRDGQMPDADFYHDLAQIVPRSAQPGQDITPPVYVGQSRNRKVSAAAGAGVILLALVALVAVWLLSQPRQNIDVTPAASATIEQSPAATQDSSPTLTVTAAHTPSATPTPEPTATYTPAATESVSLMPLQADFVITSRFSATNRGINLSAEIGTPIYNVLAGGTVVDVNQCSNCTDRAPNFAAYNIPMTDPTALADPAWGYGWGKFVRVRYSNDLVQAVAQEVSGVEDATGYTVICLYGHLSSIHARVRAGERLIIGDIIGYVGNTGNIRQPTLRLECRLIPPERESWVSGIIFDPLLLFSE